MSIVDMNYVNMKIYGEKSQKSNKNRTLDILNELAEAIGFNMDVLREDKCIGKGYAINENDIQIIKEILELGLTSEGKRLRCKDFQECYCETLAKISKDFLLLAKHNNVSDKELFNLEVTMMWKTHCIQVKHEILLKNPALYHDINNLMFAPTDYLLDRGYNEDDSLKKADIINFLYFMKKYANDDIKDLRGRYWCFVVTRRGQKSEKFINDLHEMDSEEIEESVKKAFRFARFEKILNENEQYCELLSKWADVECGRGKLQDKKKVKNYAQEMVEVMDQCAEECLLETDYNKGLPVSKKRERSLEDIDWESELAESKIVFDDAQRWYNSLRNHRQIEKLTYENEMLIEIEYRQRFEEDMF